MRGVTEAELVSLASQSLIASGITEANDRQWVAHHIDVVTIRVLAKKSLFHRLVELLDHRDDIKRGLAFARSRGCDEHEALDAVEDAMVALLQRGHGLKTEDTLLRFFRTILWEKINDLVEKRVTRKKHQEVYTQQAKSTRTEALESPYNLITAHEARDLLFSSLQGVDIPVERKASLFLKYGAGWTSEEIASLLGKNTVQVDTMNHRTRLQIRSRLGNRREQFVSVSSVSIDHAAQVQSIARCLAEKREQAALILHAIFSIPMDDVTALCGISSLRLQELASLARSEADL